MYDFHGAEIDDFDADQLRREQRAARARVAHLDYWPGDPRRDDPEDVGIEDAVDLEEGAR